MTLIAISGMPMRPVVAGRGVRRVASRCPLPGHDGF
jgi:hypothetical protein